MEMNITQELLKIEEAKFVFNQNNIHIDALGISPLEVESEHSHILLQVCFFFI